MHRVDRHRRDGHERRGQAQLGEQCGQCTGARLATLEDVGPAAHRLQPVEHGDVGAEGEQLRSPMDGVHDVGRERAAQCGGLVASGPPPHHQGRDDAGDDQGNPEREGARREDDAHDHCPQDGGGQCDGDGEQCAQVEVLQGVHVVDGPGEQVPAAPARQCGRHARGEAVVEPHAPVRQRTQGGVVADQPLGVAEGSPQEGQDLHGGQHPHERAQSGPEGGASDDVARPGKEADGGRRRGQAEEAGHGQPSVGRAGLGQHSADGASRSDRRQRRRRDVEHGVEVG